MKNNIGNSRTRSLEWKLGNGHPLMTKLCRYSFSFLSSIYHSIYHFFENDPRQSQNIIFICYDSLHVFSRMFKLRVIRVSKRNVGVFVRCVKWLTCLLLKDLELARVYNNGRNKNKQWEKERKEREKFLERIPRKCISPT